MRWITRQNVKVDRVACPWLSKRFIDPQAEFLFLREEELLERARQEEAIPFDATRFSEVKLNHRGERCTFEAIVEDYKLADPALHRLGLTSEARTSKGKKKPPPRAWDYALSRRDLPFPRVATRSVSLTNFPYDALLEYVRQQTSYQSGSR
jgi:hypothetical protein